MIPFRFKLVIAFIALVATAELSTVAALDRSLSRELTDQLSRRLEDQARGSLVWITSGRHPAQVAQRLSQIVAARVTLVDEDDAVVADSDADAKRDLGPEIGAARLFGVDTEVRDGVLYVAVSTPNEAIVRLGAKLDGVQATITLMRERLLFASGAVFLLAVFAALVVARQLARPLVAMQHAAHKIASGDDVDLVLPPASSDEIGDLSRSLRSLADQLSAVERQRRELLGDISHEIGTPVAAIQGYAETLSRGNVDAATTKEFVAIIHRHAQRIARLVDDLSLLTRLDAPEAKSRTASVTEPVSVLEVARHVAATVKPRAQERASTIVIDDVDASAVVMGDPDAVERILINLVDNAVKYGKEAGRVVVRARQAGRGVVVEVEDDGPGIDRAHIDKVFDRFYRVDKARSRQSGQSGGSGLGLAIVQKLAASMGGSASVSSEPGKGALFRVVLPADDAASARGDIGVASS